MTGRLRVAVLQSTGLVGCAQNNMATPCQRCPRSPRARRGTAGHSGTVHRRLRPEPRPHQDGALHREQLADIAVSTGMGLVASTVEHDGGRHYICASSSAERHGAHPLPQAEPLRRHRKAGLRPRQEPPVVVPFSGINSRPRHLLRHRIPRIRACSGRRGRGTTVHTHGCPAARRRHRADNPFDTRLIPSMVVPTRALENQIYIAYANHAGPGLRRASTVADPYGRRLAVADGRRPDSGQRRYRHYCTQARNDTGYLSHLTTAPRAPPLRKGPQ